MSDHGSYNVLFLGNGNVARSIMAEAILNRDGGKRFRAYSAGIAAGEAVDPQAADLLTCMHFDVSGARPKGWETLAGEDGSRFDFIFTMCEEATLLPRAMWAGQPIFAHWGIADPARAHGNDSQRRLAYVDAFRGLSNRIGIFASLPLRSLDVAGLQRRLDAIGRKTDGRAAA